MNVRLSAYLSSMAALLTLASCHETIHIHPWEEPTVNETALLTLRIDNRAPELGAVVDYTVNPPVIAYSDNLPEEAVSRAVAGQGDSGTPGAEDEVVVRRVSGLAGFFGQVAPYDLDGDGWELRMKYSIYPHTADKIGHTDVEPIFSHEVSYRADEQQPEHDAEIELPFGDITVVAVAYLVPAGTAGDCFFDTSEVHTIVCDRSRREGHHDDNIYRDCFAVSREFHVEPTGIDGNVQHLTATLKRPQGRYVVLADDYATYLDIGGNDISQTVSGIHYPTYVNSSYSVTAQRPVSSDFNFGHESTPLMVKAGDDSYVRLGDDWSIVNEPRSNININIRVKDKVDSDRIISDNPGILVPLFSDRVTLVVGHWLTEINEGGGGVSVDPDFTDEIVIRF